MKFLVILATICLTTQAANVYEYNKPDENFDKVPSYDKTVVEHFQHILETYGGANNSQRQDGDDVADVADAVTADTIAKARPSRNDCRTQCFCGTPNVNRIVGGTQVRTNKYPWTAQLVKGRHYLRLFCGGSLINDRYVLTAAHCVHNNRDQITVRLLQLDRSSRDPGITRQVVSTRVHPQYNPSTITNDVALLKLDSPIAFTQNVRPVCLPNANQNFDGKDAVVAGWGLIREGGSTSNVLQEATVPIITNQQCRATRYKDKIKDVMLCAGLVKQGGKDACQGDSGGPLIVNDGRFKLAGVVSFGFGCAQPNAPGVYARVSKFNDWIASNTRDGCYCSG